MVELLLIFIAKSVYSPKQNTVKFLVTFTRLIIRIFGAYYWISTGEKWYEDEFCKNFPTTKGCKKHLDAYYQKISGIEGVSKNQSEFEERQMDMRTSKYSEEQIIGFLRQAKAGIPIRKIGRKHGFSDTGFYNGVSA